jgi:hypothetical protein
MRRPLNLAPPVAFACLTFPSFHAHLHLGTYIMRYGDVGLPLQLVGTVPTTYLPSSR